MKGKYKITFDRLAIMNRWALKSYSRNCDWVVFGFHIWWSSPKSFCYKLCLFGLDFQFWFNREFIK